MSLLLRLLVALAALLALPATASPSTPGLAFASETASGVSAALAGEEHTYFVGELGAWVHNKAMRDPNPGRRRFESSPKHPTAKGRGQGASPGPLDGQKALDNSVSIGPNTPRRVGVDPTNGQIVVFDETHPGKGIFHGHVREWGDLSTQMQNALVNDGQMSRRGNIILMPGE